MQAEVLGLEGSGLAVSDLRQDDRFARRALRPRDPAVQMEGIRRLMHSFAQSPAGILQELVQAAVSVCGADSAGVSVVREGATRDAHYEWVATAGEYSGFLHAILPEWPSACGACLERGGAQHFTVDARFFEILDVTAPLVTDGILLPWQVDGAHGTIFVMAHGRGEAFDREDVRWMEMFADFAAMAIRNQKQQQALLLQAAANASAADRMAHRINNPLQSLTNLVFLASEGVGANDAQELARELGEPLQRLSMLVKRLLALRHDEGSSEHM